MCLGACLLLLLSFAIFADAVSLSNVLSLENQVRFKQTFYDAMPFKDLETAGYSVLGLKHYMKAEVPPTQVCNATEKRSQYVIFCHGSKISGSQQTVVLQVWLKKKQ